MNALPSLVEAALRVREPAWRARDLALEQEKQRARKALASRARGRPRKVTEEQAAEIRRLVAAGEEQADVAARYDISRSLVSLIVLGKGWAGAVGTGASR